MTGKDASQASITLSRLLGTAQLPALPQSALKLLELARDPQNGPCDFAQPIDADPGLTGQILRFVNSSYFGFSREISSVKLAISLVGVRTIKNFALWSAVFSLMPNPKCGPFDLKSMWQDSLRRGLFARAMAKTLGMKETEEAFAAALLQDMALPLLAKELPEQYAELLTQREGGRRRLSDLEREAFGWTHAEAAGQMARLWKLPAELAEAVEHHCESDSLKRGDRLNAMRRAVTLSSLLPAASDECWWECGQFEQTFNAMRPLEARSVVEHLEQVDLEFAEFAPLLKMSAPAKSLVTLYGSAMMAV